MKKRWIAIALAAVMGLALASSALAAPSARVTAKNVDFGFALYGKLKSKTENVVFSPLSLSVALQMTMMGAKGNSLKQMQKALKVNGFDQSGLNAYNQTLMRDFASRAGQDERPVVRMANGIFVKDGLPVYDAFLNDAKTYYASEIKNVDYADPKTVALVNGWIKEKTEGKIEKLFERFDDLAAMTLVNTVYFQGKWMNEFWAESTREGTFKGAKGDQNVQMMFVKRSQLYYEGRNYQAIYIPYTDQDTGMIVALPKGKTSVDTMMADIGSAAKLNKLRARFAPREVSLTLPRFTAESEMSVADALKALGMKDVFTDKADLSGIAGVKGDLCISDVKHKAMIEVAEKGTTAAAVTAVELITMSMPIVEKPIEMTVDHPFFFAVVDKSGEILFMGVINNV